VYKSQERLGAIRPSELLASFHRARAVGDGKFDDTLAQAETLVSDLGAELESCPLELYPPQTNTERLIAPRLVVSGNHTL
jgi:hypothetical protein